MAKPRVVVRWLDRARGGIVVLMNDYPLAIGESDYAILSSVQHPQGREKAFNDAFKAMVRFMIEVNNNPAVAYAIDKTDRVVSPENVELLSEDDIDEWNAACEQFESMSPKKQDAWIDRVLRTYPKLEELPDLDSYNHLQ